MSVPAPAWQAGSWYESPAGAPPRADWEKAMGYAVPVQPEPKKGSYTMDNTSLEMKDSSLIMKIMYSVTENIIAKSFGGKKDLSDPAYRMMLICSTDCPKGLIDMANGHPLRGLGKMIRG